MKNENRITNISLSESLERALRKEFLGRCKRNPAYSMRAFSKFLEIDQSNLSKIMQGKREISKLMAQQIGLKLGMKPSAIHKMLIKTSINASFLPLEDDEFSVISEWQHFAILELTKTKGFEANPNQVAKRLGIHVEEVRASVTRLERMGLLKVDSDEWKVNSSGNTWTNTKTTNEARKQLQKSLLEKGLKAIDVVPFEQRENGSLTVAIDKKRLPEFKEKLKQIRQELGEYFQSDSEINSDLNEVYQLTIAFYPLTNTQGESHEDDSN